MLNLSIPLNDAIAFTRKVKEDEMNLLNVTFFRLTEYRKYVQAAQSIYPIWVYLTNEKPEQLQKFAQLTVNQVGDFIYRLHEIKQTNISLPLFRQQEILFMLESITDMYDDLITAAAPDAVAAVYDILLKR